MPTRAHKGSKATPRRAAYPSAARALLTPEPTSEATAAQVDEVLRAKHRAHILSEAVELAVRDDSFRKQLAAKLRDLGEGRPRRTTSLFDLMQIGSVHQILTLGLAGTRRAHLLKTPRVFDEIALRLGITPSQAKERFYKAKRKGLIP